MDFRENRISNIKYTMLTGDRMGIEWKWQLDEKQGGSEKIRLTVFRLINDEVLFDKIITFDEYSRALRHQHGIVVPKIDCPVGIRLESDDGVLEEASCEKKYKIILRIKEKGSLLSQNKKMILEIDNQSGFRFEKSFLMYFIGASKVGRADMISYSDGNFGFIPAIGNGINQYSEFVIRKNQVFSVVCCDDEMKKWFEIKEER